MLADLPDGRPNPNTHAYGHRDLAAEDHRVADQPEPGVELIIWHPEERFVHVIRRLELAGAMEMEEKLLDNGAERELHGDQLLMAERIAAARSGGAIRMNEVIEQIIARDNFGRPVSPPARMPAPPTQQRTGPSGLNANSVPFRLRADSFDEDEPKGPTMPPRRPHLKFDNGDYEQEDTELQPVRIWKSARRRTIRLSTTKPDWPRTRAVTKKIDDKNDDFSGFIEADDVEY